MCKAWSKLCTWYTYSSDSEQNAMGKVSRCNGEARWWYIEEPKMEKQGAREWIPLSHPTARKLPVQQGTNTTGELRWCTIWMENYSHGNTTQSGALQHSQKCVTSHRTFLKIEGTNNICLTIGVFKRRCSSCEVQDVNELQSALPMKCLPVSVQKLNIILMCVMPLMVPYWDLLST